MYTVHCMQALISPIDIKRVKSVILGYSGVSVEPHTNQHTSALSRWWSE